MNFQSCVWITALMLTLTAGAGEKLTSVTIDNQTLKEIRDVHLSADGRIVIIYEGGAIAVNDEKIPNAFLESWKIEKNTAQATKKTKNQEDFEKALNEKKFREINGVVYDLRKPQPEWRQFIRVKLIQIVEDGALVDPEPHSLYSQSVLFVSNLSHSLGDQDDISFIAKQIGTYSYINKIGDRRTVRSFDCGRACSRDDIPDEIITNNQSSAKIQPSRHSNVKDVIAALPDSASLKANGSGFFITEDGYLISNNHVIKKSKSIKIKTKAGVFSAEVVKTDPEVDLALLKTTGKFKPLAISKQTKVQVGDAVFTIGFPNIDIQGVEPKYTDGKISSLSGFQDDPTEYQISVPVQPGNSGGALINSEGYVVGIIVSKLNDISFLKSSGSVPQNVNYAIKSSVLLDFLKSEKDVNLISGKQIKQNEVISFSEDCAAMILVYQ